MENFYLAVNCPQYVQTRRTATGYIGHSIMIQSMNRTIATMVSVHFKFFSNLLRNIMTEIQFNC